MKVYIITQEEPFFVPKMILRIAEASRTEIFDFTGITVLKPYRKNRSFRHWFQERARIYTGYELFLVVFAVAIAKVSGITRGKRSPYSVSSIAKVNGIELYNFKDINDAGFINHIENLKVDLLISISCPQLFKTALLRQTNMGCINAHGTLLPRHRGVFGSWWVLFENDLVGGSTIHTMVEQVDRGDIVWQKEFPITKEHSQFGIAYQTKKDMADGLIEVILKYRNNSVRTIAPKYASSYHYAPTKELGKEFHRRKKRVLRFGDLKLMLSQRF